MNKKWLIAAGMVIVLAAGGTWYFKAKGSKAAPSNFMLGEVTRGNVVKEINATGTVQSPSQYNLSFDGKSKLIKVNVAVGDSVKIGQELAEVDNAAANQQVLQAKASLTQAKIKLDQLKAGASNTEILAAQSSLTRAEANLYNAQQNLNTLESYRDPQVLAEAIKNAGGPGGGNLVAYQNPDNLEAAIQQAKNALNSAQVDYDLAKAQLAAKKAGPSSADIQSAQLQVEQAQAALASAQASYDSTVLKSPVDGIVTAINGKVGEFPGTGGSNNAAFMVILGNSDTMQIVVPVDEADIGSVKEGQLVNITLPAYQNKTFSGSVVQVAPAGQQQSNVTTFDVTISADNKDKLMKSGMSANVSIILEKKENVVMVPSEAVRGNGEQKSVLLPPEPGSQQPGRARVEIGLDDGSNAEVISGLEEGQKVIIGTRVLQTPGQSGGNPFNFGSRSGGSRLGR